MFFILWLFLTISTCMLGMKSKTLLSDIAFSEWVKSYEITEISHNGGRVFALDLNEKTKSLLVGTESGLLQMDCLNNEIKSSKNVVSTVKELISSDEGAYYVDQRGRVFDWNQKNDDVKLVYQGPVNKLAYGSYDKSLWCVQTNGIIKIDSTTGYEQDSYPVANTSAICCGPNNGVYVGMREGVLLLDCKANLLKKLPLRISGENTVNSINRSMPTGTLYLDTGEDIIRRCDARLTLPRNIYYGGYFGKTLALEHDYVSQLLCAAVSDANSNDAAKMIHVFHPKDASFAHELPFNCEYPKCACSPLTSTFYIAGKNKIAVLKPKRSYSELTLMNSNAYLIYKEFLCINGTQAVKGDQA